MGQYYRATLLNENKEQILATTIGWDWKSGAKLMETAWVGNHMVNAVCQLLAGDFKGSRVVWAGDYAETPFMGEDNLYTVINENEEKYPKVIEMFQTKEYEMYPNVMGIHLAEFKAYKYVINLDKKVAVPIPEDKGGENEWHIHPLPLLTAESNGMGGGDYFSDTHEEFVGTWAYDRITVGNEIPEGFEVLDIEFSED